jgi:hypothetical protein
MVKMHMLKAFQTPDNMPAINEVLAHVMMQLDGASYAIGLAGLFSAFVTVCHQADLDPGAEFEYTLATFEERAAATHRAALNQ